ncbi:MAG: sodium:proton antiporter [Proteobacteria bacterium]|nr:sodium:proton antiporter [Pseudomonadota bacterium]MBU1057546.1 sodium:proton antiporter [Pseudomonadota bacterium]
MTLFDIVAILVTFAALFSFVNERFIGLPRAIGLMAMSLVFSLVLMILGKMGFFSLAEYARELLSKLDFYNTLMHGMLGFLLFAGALHVNFDDLLKEKTIIFLLSTVGVLFSTLFVGGLAWAMLALLGMDLPLIYCFLFGALISPTDPIAVLGIMKKAGAPKNLETTVTGESLFNDGIGVVVFLALLAFVQGGDQPGLNEIAHLFLVEAVGGIAYGALVGYATYFLLKRVDKYQVEVLITLATVIGGYRSAELLHVSAPLAIVVAGLLVGNHGRHFGMSPLTRRRLDTFWELIDEILNAVLFVLIGLEYLILPHNMSLIVAGTLMIPLVLLARFLSVGTVSSFLRIFHPVDRGTVRILTWAGLRGGISVALALSLPFGPERNSLIAITYTIMAFSILIQGLTVGRLIKNFAVKPRKELSTSHGGETGD